MQTKLTLRLDKQLIQNAKNYARHNDTSLSKLVSEYFGFLLTDRENIEPYTEQLPPITRSLVGRFKDIELDEDNYYRHLEEKHQ